MEKRESYPDAHHDPSANLIFGFWIYLMTDFILFATLFAAYAVLRKATFGGPTAQELLDLPLALASTLVLLTSTLSCGMATLGVQHNQKGRVFVGYGITFLLGVAFLCLIGVDFAGLIAQGQTWTSNAFLSAYFTLIGLHGLHIVCALIFMIFFLAQVYVCGLIPMTIRRLTCLKQFWFFSYIVWVLLFTIVYLIGAV